MCWSPAKTSWNAPTGVCKSNWLPFRSSRAEPLGKERNIQPPFYSSHNRTRLTTRSRAGSLDHLSNVLKLLSIHWVRSLFCSAAGCGELIFKQRVCRIQEGEQQPAGTLWGLDQPRERTWPKPSVVQVVSECAPLFSCLFAYCKYQDIHQQPPVLCSVLSHMIKRDNFHHPSPFLFLLLPHSLFSIGQQTGCYQQMGFISDRLKGSESLSVGVETLHFSGPNCSRNRACFCKKIHSHLPSCLPSPAPGDSGGPWLPAAERRSGHVIRETLLTYI